MPKCADLRMECQHQRGPESHQHSVRSRVWAWHVSIWMLGLQLPSNVPLVSGDTVTQSEDQSFSGMGSVHAQSQGCGWIEDPSKKKTQTTALPPWRMSSKGGIFQSQLTVKKYKRWKGFW